MLNGELTFVRRQVADTRIPAPGFGEPRALRFELPGDSRVVRWSLEHLLMPSPMAASHGLQPARVRTVVASGEIELSRE